MEKIKPKDSKYLKELYFNPTLTIVFTTLFVLNSFDILVIVSNKNIHILFSILFFVLAIYFLIISIVNLFYKIEISDDIITFYTPFNLYKKRVVFSTIDDFRFKKTKIQDDTLIFFLKTGEVISVGIRRYSETQKKELKNLINKKKA